MKQGPITYEKSFAAIGSLAPAGCGWGHYW